MEVTIDKGIMGSAQNVANFVGNYSQDSDVIEIIIRTIEHPRYCSKHMLCYAHYI